MSQEEALAAIRDLEFAAPPPVPSDRLREEDRPRVFTCKACGKVIPRDRIFDVLDWRQDLVVCSPCMRSGRF